ncbi:MAG: DNA recombination protein RmuC [Alphaproteobacteria bacterium]|nr:DNA recombination protein RmuC [Alphaproteobacteria bacterium]
MLQAFLSEEKNIFLLLSIICGILFIFWMIFFIGYIRKKRALNKVLVEQTEYRTWKGFAEDELDHTRNLLATVTDEKINLLKENERLKSDMSAQQKYLSEQIEFLRQNKQELSEKFQNISNEIIKAQNASFNENQKTTMNFILKPFADQLAEFKKKMDASHDDSVKFDEQIRHLFDLNNNLSKEAQNLTNALKGNKKIQGNWGEFQLERVLEISGLQKGINYFCQETFKDENEKVLRPDVIVQLPDDRQVIIDSKVSLNDYVDFVNAEDEAARSEALKKHITCIRKHIDELSSKEYQKLLKDESLDYVMIFIPIEGAYVEAAHADLGLYDYALSKNIAITTPSSLLPLLRTIENLWQLDKRNKSAAELADIGGKIYDKLAGFMQDMKQIDKSLEAAHGHYNDAMTKLAGKGSAISFAIQLKEKGAKVSKQLTLEGKQNETQEERNLNE